jgi:hypothetical protein
MKSIRMTLAIALSALALTSFAAGPDWPPAPWQRISSKKEATDCCEAGGKVAYSCKDCKVLNEVTDKKAAAALFDKKATHECSGCKGKITLSQAGSGKGPLNVKYTHDCSKCGKGTAFTCASHVKGAK